MAENASPVPNGPNAPEGHPGSPDPGDQAYDPVRRHIMLRSPEPINIHLDAGQPAIAWPFDIVPAVRAPAEPFWTFAAQRYEAGPGAVGIMLLDEIPPEVASGFNVYTAGRGEASKRRLAEVIGNMLTLANYRVDPEPAMHLLHPITTGLSEETVTAEEKAEELAYTAEPGGYDEAMLRYLPRLDPRLVEPVPPFVAPAPTWAPYQRPLLRETAPPPQRRWVPRPHGYTGYFPHQPGQPGA